jgi:hypothetical protein
LFRVGFAAMIGQIEKRFERSSLLAEAGVDSCRID